MIRADGRTKLSVLRAHWRYWRENSRRNGWLNTLRDWRRLRHNVRIAINCAKPMPWLRSNAWQPR